MRNLKILMFLFVAALFIQCDNLEENQISEKEIRLETAEYIMENEMSKRPDIFSFEGCYTFKDSVIKKAEYLTPFINYLGGDRRFDNSEYSVLYSDTRNTIIKETYMKILIMVIGVIVLMGMFLIGTRTEHKSLLTIITSTATLAGIILISLVFKIPIIPDNTVIEQEVKRQYFICNTS